MADYIKVKIFKALADETRCEIVGRMMSGEISCECIVRDFSLSRPALSHHLRILREANVINARKEGQFYHYTLNRIFLEECLPGLIKALKK
ncbi:MAG TPA: ArsR family transcriptional regulator [Actinobacteria bacterium]|nr:ArsR family transcriptional regulator [Actinomycetota bacterium]